MRYSIEDGLKPGKFDISLADVSRSDVKKINEAIEPSLFGVTPYTDNTTGPFSITLEVMKQTVQDFYTKGEKIYAIRFVRAVTGWGWKESKDFCDSFSLKPF